LRRGPTIQTKISLAAAGIYCTTSLPLLRATEDSSIVPQVQQLQLKSSIVEGVHITTYNACSARCGTYSRRSRTSAKRRRSLARYDATMWNARQRPMNERRKASSRRTGVPVASVADGAPALCVWTSSTSNQTVGGVLYQLQPVQPRCRRTESCSSPRDRRRTPIGYTNVLLASSDNDRTACRSWRSW